MDIRAVLKSQYHAALKTLRFTIEQCPDEMWNEADASPPYWGVVYHTLYHAHFYLMQSPKVFVPWEKHRDKTGLGGGPQPYSRQEMLEYWHICNEMIDAGIDKLDLSARCGFSWYKMSTLEHQIVNIRHIQNHAAALATRLRLKHGIAVDWVGGGGE